MEGTLSILKGWLDAAEGLFARLSEGGALLRSGGWPAELLAAVAGVALLAAGVRLGRVLAAAGGALVGGFTGLALAPAFQAWGIRPAWTAIALGSTLAVASFLAPAAYPVLLGVLPGALLGTRYPVAGHASLGAAAGGLALGLVGLALRRLVFAATAAVTGAALVSAVLAALATRFPALEVLVKRPVLLMGIALLLAVAGTAFQFGASRPRGGRAPAGERQRLRED